MKRNHHGRERATALMRQPFIRSFDYESLAPDAAARARAAADKIRELNRSMAASAVTIGKELIAVREALGKRMFTVWLAAEFCYSQATASNLMSIGRRFADLDCLEQFDHSALYELARPRVAPEAVNETIARARSGERISKVKALTVIEAHEMAAEADPQPKPRRDEVGRIKSALRRAISRWPVAQRETLARELLSVIRDVLLEYGLDPELRPAPPRLATGGNRKPVRGDVRSRAAAIGIAVG